MWTIQQKKKHEGGVKHEGEVKHEVRVEYKGEVKRSMWVE